MASYCPLAKINPCSEHIAGKHNLPQLRSLARMNLLCPGHTLPRPGLFLRLLVVKESDVHATIVNEGHLDDLVGLLGFIPDDVVVVPHLNVHGF